MLDLDKIGKNIRTTINRLSDYRQSFGVAILPIFNETGDLIYETPTFITQRIFIEKQVRATYMRTRHCPNTYVDRRRQMRPRSWTSCGNITPYFQTLARM